MCATKKRSHAMSIAHPKLNNKRSASQEAVNEKPRRLLSARLFLSYLTAMDQCNCCGVDTIHVAQCHPIIASHTTGTAALQRAQRVLRKSDRQRFYRTKMCCSKFCIKIKEMGLIPSL